MMLMHNIKLHHEAGSAGGAGGDGAGRGRRVAREQVNRYFDREMSREEREAFFKSLHGDAETAQEVVRMQAALSRLDEPTFGPDLTEQVLAKVHSRRRFLSVGQRRLVTGGRVAVGAAVLMAIGAVSLLKRENPGLSLRATPAPVSGVVANGQADLAGMLQQVTRTMVAAGTMPIDDSAQDLMQIAIDQVPSGQARLNWEVEAHTESGVVWVSVSAGEWRRLMPMPTARSTAIGGPVDTTGWATGRRTDGLVIDDGLAARLGMLPGAQDRMIPPMGGHRVP